MCQDRVDPLLGDPAAGGFGANHAGKEPLDGVVPGDGLGRRRRAAIPAGRCRVLDDKLPGRRPASGVEHVVANRRDAFARRRGHADDGAAKPAAEFVDIDSDALAIGNVGERESDDDRQPDAQGLGGEVEVALEIGGVGHDEDAVGPRHVGHAAVQNVDHHALVRALGQQAVGAGQIDEVDLLAAVREAAQLLFDRHAGIVADAGGNAGQRREQRAFADIRVAEQNDGQWARRHR